MLYMNEDILRRLQKLNQLKLSEQETGDVLGFFEKQKAEMDTLCAGFGNIRGMGGMARIVVGVAILVFASRHIFDTIHTMDMVEAHKEQNSA